jgi:uncharacterized cupredoxin-like copper-binding protein
MLASEPDPGHHHHRRRIAMKPMRANVLLAATSIALTLFAGQASAAGTIIKVSLWDKGAMALNMVGKGPMMGMAMGSPGSTMHEGPMGPMGIKVSTHDAKAGPVTFAVTNASKQLVHEMVLSPVKDGKTPLPYDKAGQKVDEDAAGHLGEVAELEPGKSGALTVDLKPGKYILYCNIPDHYILGMWTLITVK